MKIRSKAPLRIGLAGGGTDVSPFCDIHGGCVLNATINMFAYCSLEETVNGQVEFISKDIDVTFSDKLSANYTIDGVLTLHKAVYNRIVAQFNNGEALPLKVTTWTDVPMGSGLGTSSTIVVAIISAYREYLNLPLGEYDVAQLAYDIERIDCNLSGGKQDQYAATFGGVNFIEFSDSNKVIVNPLRIKQSTLYELESRMVLYYTGLSRESAKIIDDQVKAVSSTSSSSSLDAMFALKSAALKMKEALLKSDIESIIELVRESWIAKIATSSSITNPRINDIISRFESCGVQALKLSGAGGGGFMLLFIEPEDRFDIEKSVSDLDGKFFRFQFKNEGECSWKI
ncbi:dehydrogenase [Rosenbergiella epipactidis]|uniref:GHMP family kinase ATP-binding protein n=1 Tax=Rosenbergiella epipactidis TaxID=1544694 RepID=UPI001F4D8E3E|nr:dehydrogenase [Rosenbergiella epipactidis]MCL9668599.1 dehydrogenase [Rosenbergiella epipactidis]